MSAYSDSEIIDLIKKDNREILIYLFEANEDTVKEKIEVVGGSEDDFHALMEDALIRFWTQVKNNEFILNEGVNVQFLLLIDQLLKDNASSTTEDKYISATDKLKKYISTNTNVKYVSYNRGKVGVSIPLFVLVLAGIGWGIIYYKPVEIRTIKEFIRIPFYVKKENVEETDSSTALNMEAGESELLKTAVAHKDSSGYYANSKDSIAGLSFVEVIEDSVSDDEIVIRKDMLLTARMLKISDKSINNETDDKSLTKEITEKLNPEAKLPEYDKSPKSIQVEFWKSPVNYTGYKMNKNKLVLYGFDEPEVLKLFSLDNIIYLSYQQNIYKLDMVNDFESLNKIKDATILSLLK